MTKENKELLLRDLCCRLPYGVKCQTSVPVGGKTLEGIIASVTPFGEGFVFIGFIEIQVEKVKPYLRPMSSMTREEWEEYNKIKTGACYFGSSYTYLDMYDWLLTHHFDYRGLIEKGLALEAPKDMYNKNVCSEI